jgi:hypothetical protein
MTMKSSAEPNEFHEAAIDEAMEALGLLKPDARTTLLALLPGFLLDPSTNDFRKAGAQLSTEEKKALGISSRAFLSHEALGELTEDGVKEPTYAHECTLHRALLTIGRACALDGARNSDPPVMAKRICPGSTACARTELWSDLEAFGPFPPKDCADNGYRTCRSVFVFRRKSRLT